MLKYPNIYVLPSEECAYVYDALKMLKTLSLISFLCCEQKTTAKKKNIYIYSTIKVPAMFCQTEFSSGAGSKLVGCNRKQAEFELHVIVMCILNTIS